MHLYEKQFDESHDYVDAPPHEKTLIIASTPRCGSHMLGHSLRETGRFGFPLEYANPANLRKWQQILGASDNKDTIKKIIARRTGPNGVFGIKLHYSHIKSLGSFADLTSLFPNAYFVMLLRKDVLDQAVSFAIARRTGVWIDGQEPVSGPPTYDFDEIDRCLARIVEDCAAWRYALASHGCKWIEMDFDHAKQDMPGAMDRIARFMDVEPPENLGQAAIVTKRQANAINQEWRRRFLAEHDGRGLNARRGRKGIALIRSLLPRFLLQR